MNPFSKILGALGIGAKSTTITGTPMNMSAEMIRVLGGGTMSSSGKVVNESTAMTLSAVFACRRIISEALGCLPWAIYEKRVAKSGREEIYPAENYPLSDVLTYAPNRDQTQVEFRETIGASLSMNGNWYAMTDRLANRVTSIYPIRSALVEPKRKKGTNTKLPLREGEIFYTVQEGSQKKDYTRDEIWHVKGFGDDVLAGVSPIGAARQAAGMSLATEEFGASFFRQGAKPSGYVSIEKFLKKEDREIARENLQQMMGGMGNMHRFALFEGGMKPEPWGDMPLQDMEFVLLRRFNVLEICRFFRIPPHMVFELEKGASYASIEQMSSEFVIFTLLPYFTRIEASAARWLMSPADARRYFLRFNYEGFLRADSKVRGEYLAQAVQNGLMSRNEARAKENLNPVDGLDEYTAQTNLAPVDSLRAIAERTAAKPAGGKSADDNSSKDFSFKRFLQKARGEMADHSIHINVSPPSVNVAPADVKIAPAQITVAPASVSVTPDVKVVFSLPAADGEPKTLKLDASEQSAALLEVARGTKEVANAIKDSLAKRENPQVDVHVNVPVPEVKVTNEVQPAETTVNVNLPARVSTSVIDRDVSGNIKKVTTNEKDA